MFVGREKERGILLNALKDDRSHFIAVYGRRRIGKTYLVRESFDYRFTFQHAGLYGGTTKEQLFAFDSSLKDAGYVSEKPSLNWMVAFEKLKDLIRSSTEKRKLIFIDELSWMDTKRCDLMPALENFWNAWASARKDVVLIICASATSWMLSNVIHNKGGLYNRLTEQINLKQFTLGECENYAKARGLSLTRNQIVSAYMVLGGVPYYWDFLQKGLSIQQNIDRMFFSEDAPLKDEFDYLYASIFRNPEEYIKIIEALGKKKAGMTRDEIIESAHVDNSGLLSTRLSELESCGFIRTYYSLGMKKKNAVYQLSDCFTLFYYKFLSQHPTDNNYWSNQINTPAVNAWCGLAFERVCMLHVDQIKQKLGIAGVSTEIKSWYCKADPDRGLLGSQTDLLIVRRDNIINLCEIKYSEHEYAFTQHEQIKMQHRIHDVSIQAKNKYAIHPTLIASGGLLENLYSSEIQAVVTLNDLFVEL